MCSCCQSGHSKSVTRRPHPFNTSLTGAAKNGVLNAESPIGVRVLSRPSCDSLDQGRIQGDKKYLPSSRSDSVLNKNIYENYKYKL